MYDFFISHSSIDNFYIVEDLVAQLQYMGYKVWYDKDRILAGDNIPETVKKGLECSYCVILAVTENFFESQWSFFETGFSTASNERTIVPLLYDVSREKRELLLGMIGTRKYLDMNLLTNQKTASELAKILKRTQEKNRDLRIIEKIENIKKRLATYETVNSEEISLDVKSYLTLLENNKEYAVLEAKKIVKIILGDLFKQKKVYINDNEEALEIIKLLEIHNIGSINFREYVEFILCKSNEKIVDNDKLTILNSALLYILTFYLHIRYPSSLSFNQIKVALPNELTYSDFQDMYEIDRKVMRDDLIADADTAYAWFKYNEYTHIGVRDTVSKKIIGYFSVLPINKETYDQIVSGDFKDNEFTSDNLEQYIFPDFYKIYVAGVGIAPEYQNTGAFIMLYNAFIDLIILLAKEREIYISEVLAEASTKQGEKFCKMVGMKKISSTGNATDVYRLVTIPPEFRHTSQKGKELFQLCETKFKQYKEYFSND